MYRLAGPVAVAAALSLVMSASAGTHMLGRSWHGTPLTVTRVGDPDGTPVLVVGSIHGDETGGMAVARALRRLSPRGVDLWIVPTLNPDGVAAGTRGNARGVDLNRNFPWQWRPLDGVYESGSGPLSERESRIGRALVLRVRPRLTVWFHQHLRLVWASGGDPRVEHVFARVSGLPYRSRPKIPGSATAWQNATFPHTTAFVAELPPGAPGPGAVRRYARAVLEAAHAAS